MCVHVCLVNPQAEESKEEEAGKEREEEEEEKQEDAAKDEAPKVRDFTAFWEGGREGGRFSRCCGAQNISSPKVQKCQDLLAYNSVPFLCLFPLT